MNRIILYNAEMPVVHIGNHLAAQESFYHVDRIISLAEAWNQPDFPWQWGRNMKLLSLLREAAEYGREEKQPRRLSDRIAEFLSEHYQQPFSAAVLEKRFFLSYKRMAFVFKAEI